MIRDIKLSFFIVLKSDKATLMINRKLSFNTIYYYTKLRTFEAYLSLKNKGHIHCRNLSTEFHTINVC